MKWTEDFQRKQALAQELFYLLGTAGLEVSDVTYGIEDREEVYTVQMKNGANYRINVTCDSPITAAYDVIKFMQCK